MFRDGAEEAIVALDAASGKTIWEQRYDSAPEDGHVDQFGRGPRATPTISGDKLYGIGVAGMLNCVSKKDGTVIWSHDLWAGEFNGNTLPHGYSSSPLVYKNSVIVLVGGKGASVVALDKNTGKVKWSKHDYENSYSTPRLFDVDGQQQVVAFMDKQLIGLDPDTGDLEWSYEMDGSNITMPVMVDKNHLFVSSLNAGSRGLKLTVEDGKTKLEEVWSIRKIQYFHNTTVQQGNWVYGSTGNQPAFLSATNLRTGEIAWRERGLAKANVTAADGKVIILDEDGKLYLTTVSPEGLEIHSEVELFDEVSWTVPTIVGKTLYVRDTKKIVALDLG